MSDDPFDDDEVLQSLLQQLEREEQAETSATTTSVTQHEKTTLPATTTGAAAAAAAAAASSPTVATRGGVTRLGGLRCHEDESDDENRLQALVHLTASTPSFRKSSTTSSATAGAPTTGQPTRPPRASAARAEASSVLPRAEGPSTSDPSAESDWGLGEEEKVLESILDAIHCQQSTVSGDLATDTQAQTVEAVLNQAELVASAGVLATDGPQGAARSSANGKGDHVLHFHEHIELKAQLEKVASTLGRPTCSALVPLCAVRDESSDAAEGPSVRDSSMGSASHEKPTSSELFAAVGTSLGVVALLDARWRSLGVLGSVDAETVRARNAVISLALTEDGYTCVSGHAKGILILWSVAHLAPVRILADEFAAPVLSIRALHAEQGRFLALDAAGNLRLLRPSRIMGATVVRSVTVVQSTASATPLADFDVIPYPSNAYLMDTNSCVTAAPIAAGGAAALFSGQPNASGTALGSPLTVPDRHLVACVFSDTVLLYSLDKNASAAVARHTHPPNSSLSNELVQFVLLEQDRPEVRLCVAWNTEVELLRVRFDVGGDAPTVVRELERLATVRHAAPIATLCAVTGGNALYLDQEHRVTLMDTTVAVEAERPVLSSQLDLLSFTHRLCGVRYKGAMSSNRQSVLAVGRKTAFSIALLPWYTRLDALVERQLFPKALELLQSFTQEVALSMVGLSSRAATRRRALSAYMTKVSVAYLRYAATQSSTQPLVVATGEVLSRCCVMDMMPVFWGPVMSTLRELGQQDVALYSLEAGMRNGQVTSLPEPLIDAFYALFTDSSRLEAVQDATSASTNAAGTKHDVSSTDGKTRAETALLHLEDGLDMLMSLARVHGLVRLEVCVLSLRKAQYVSALDVALASDAAQPPGRPHGSSAAVDYVLATLQGLSVAPELVLPVEHRSQAKRLVWESLFSESSQREVRFSATLNGDAQSGTSPRTPSSRLKLLLRLDGSRVLHSLLDSLDELGPCSAWSWDSTVAPDGAASVIVGTGGDARLSALVHVLGCLVSDRAWATSFLAPQPEPLDAAAETKSGEAIDEDDRPFACPPSFDVYEIAQRPWPPYSLVDQYLSGVASLLSSDDCPFTTTTEALTDGSLASPRSPVWSRLGGCLATHFVYQFRAAEDDQQRRRVQDALIRVVRAPVFQYVSFRAFEADFSRNNMARATAALLCDAGDYGAAIDCFLDPQNAAPEPDLSKGVFAMLSTEMARLTKFRVAWHATHPSDSASTALEERTGRSAVNKAKSNGSRLRRAVMDHVPALVKVDATALAQFVFEYLPSNNAEVIKVLRNSSGTFLKYLDELIAKRDPAVLSDMGLQNTYIELLSAHDPSKVLPYLQNQGTAITYDVQQALRAVRRYHVADAAIYLRERMNMIPQAMQTLFDAMQDSLRELRRATIQEIHDMCPDSPSHGAARPSDSLTSRPSLVASVTEGVAAAASPVRSASTDARSVTRRGSTQAPGRLFERRHVLAVMGPAVREVDKFFELGESLCSAYDSQSDKAGNYWFQLLDMLATPRRLLSQRLEQHTQLVHQNGSTVSSPRSAKDATFTFNEMDAAFGKATAEQTSDPQSSSSSVLITVPPLTQPLSDEEVCYTQTMVDILTAYTSTLLHGMIDALDMTSVVEKVVKDHEQERFEPFRPIILDVMSSIRFNVAAHRLAQTCAVDDVVRLGRELYRQLNRGAVPRTDTCSLCREPLCDPPSVSSQTNASAVEVGDRARGALSLLRSVLVFGCGHAYHEMCAAQWKQVTHSRQCPQCTQRRLGEMTTPGGAGTVGLGTGGAESVDDTTPSAKGQSLPAPALDDATWQKRLRFLRARLSNHSSSYYEILKASVGSQAEPLSAQSAGGGGSGRPRLMLSSPTPPLVSASHPVKSTADLTQSITETLTDADILELFGG